MGNGEIGEIGRRIEDREMVVMGVGIGGKWPVRCRQGWALGYC